MYEKKTIEEKAKAYDEATKTIKASLDALNDITEMGEKVVNIQPIKNCFYRAFPELKNKEDEDEKIRKEILSYIKSSGAVTNKQWIAWLEKQGNQNLPSVNERAWLYLVDDVLTWNDGIGQYLDDPRVQKLAKDLCSEYAQKLYNFPISSNSSNVENNKQEPADKDKPKFKIEEGKWYVCTQTYTLQGKIVAIKGQTYKSYQDGAIEGEDERLFIDKIDGKALNYFKPWTINDAKDGDVLVANNDLAFIYNGYLEEQQRPFAYGGINIYGRFNISDGLFPFTHQKVVPATKKQCNLLFQKMHDAGYTFDFEKKELKKIEDKPLVIDEGKDEIDRSFTKMMLKDYTKQKPVEWSEKDEKTWKELIEEVKDQLDSVPSPDCRDKEDEKALKQLTRWLVWLKSLKQRIGG